MNDKTILTLPPASAMADSEITYETQRMAILHKHYAELLRTVEARQRELEGERERRQIAANGESD